MTQLEMMSPEGLWATARGYDLKAPHWDDLDEVTREQIRRIAATVRPTTAKMFERVEVPDTLKFDPAVVTALSPFLFAVDGSPLGQVKMGYLRDLSLASYEAGRRDAGEPPKAVEISAPFATITVDTKNIGNPRRGDHSNRSTITFAYATTGHTWTEDREREIVTHLTAGGMWQNITHQPDGSWVVLHGYDSSD